MSKQQKIGVEVERVSRGEVYFKINHGCKEYDCPLRGVICNEYENSDTGVEHRIIPLISPKLADADCAIGEEIERRGWRNG